MNGQEDGESGLQLNAWIAPISGHRIARRRTNRQQSDTEDTEPDLFSVTASVEAGGTPFFDSVAARRRKCASVS
jgi:hypothetical protein